MRRRDPADLAAVRRHEPLHAQADAEHRPGAGGEHLAADGEVGGYGGVSRPRREHHERMRQHFARGHLVVLHDRRQDAGHRRDEVDEVPRVGVVVVDHDHVRDHGHNLVQTSGRAR